MVDIEGGNSKKRRHQDAPEIEVDVKAPEPPSKKALRKAKKKTSDQPEENAEQQPTAEAHDDSEKRTDHGIWIGNLPFSVTKDDIRRFITSHCTFADTTITRVHLPKGAEKFGQVQNKGFAYVDLATEKAANEALGLSEQLLSGRRVLIKGAKNFSGRPENPQKEGHAASAGTSGHPPSKRIFVGNLGYDASKEILEEHFGQCGTVKNVHVASFQDTGKCKGYAWVEFTDVASAEAAVKGFVMVDENDGNEEEEGDEEESSKNAKKPRQRRVWVNNLLGRRMRMEFAEDPTTRYNKRFGKDKKTKQKNTEFENEPHGQNPNEEHLRSRNGKGKAERDDYTRYDKDTVQKLSGAIVESQGKKTTFE